MTITERHEKILAKLNEKGKVEVPDLSESLNVSEVTIRKDLRILEDKGLLFRTHGGATKTNPYTSDKPVQEKEFVNITEKNSIAKEAVKLIGDNDSIILGSGTSILAMARCLDPEHPLNVITSAINVSMELAQHENIEILQLGGHLRHSSTSVVGSYAESFLDNITCGMYFLGVDGIDLDFGITTTNLGEASLNQKCIEVAQVTVVLADSSKFGKRGFGRICNLDQIQHIITDGGVSTEIVQELENRGIKVSIVDVD
ncbi:MAG TPA: transcriptional regulator [Balneolaceae bacterium]|nr:transcriptional regulator [Balneolaceae bacterium]|tara:strand:+ start:14675 stop:15445 length:771 start_codon:yes stop_codon:yes gene_type:complete